MTMSESYSELQDRILQQINAKHWNAIDEIWLEALAQGHPPAEFHAPIVHRLARRKPDRLRALYEPYLKELNSGGGGEQAAQVIDMILSEDSAQEWLRPILITALRDAHKHRPAQHIEDFLTRSGLENETTNLLSALRSFDDLIGATKGQVFLHRAWGLGVVQEMDPDTNSVLIDFQLKKGQRMTLEGVRNFLEKVPKDHVDAIGMLDPARLREMMSADPGGLIRLALKSYGGRQKVGDLKRILTKRIMSEAEYKTFWNNARPAIKLDPWVEMSGTGLHAELFLRDKPQTFLDENIKRLTKAKTIGERREVLRDIAKHGDEAEVSPEDLAKLQALFSRPLAEGKLTTDAEKLTHGLLFLEFESLFGDMKNPIEIDPYLQREHAGNLIRQAPAHELRRIALQRLMEVQPERWPEIFAELMPDMDTRTVTWMERELRQRGHEHYYHVGIENIFARPDDNPELFTWAARNILVGNWKELAESLPQVMILEEVFSLLSELEMRFEDENKAVATEARNMVAKVRGLLNEDNSKIFKQALGKSTVEEARRLLRTIRLHNALPDQLKHTLETILINQHRDLRQVSRMDEEEERKKPAFHYTTRQALDEKRQYLSQLLNQEIPGMAKVIEAARELGDLRENSEYHAAKDRQKLLMQQAAELEDLIARARLFETRDDDTVETSRFGTRVGLREVESGNESVYTIMGMWEADLEKGVISYLTPFGSQLLGRKLGEKFTVQATDGNRTDYELTSIANVLKH